MGVFDRGRTVRYAARWWNGFNPEFRVMPDDCTHFVSQCLWAGGHSMVGGGDRNQGWWYRDGEEGWSYSWAVAHALRWWLVTSGRAELVPEAAMLLPGDVIGYDWKGSGTIGHTAVVVSQTARLDPLIAAHTAPSFRRHWTYTDSPAYTPQTRYLFLRLREDYPG